MNETKNNLRMFLNKIEFIKLNDNKKYLFTNKRFSSVLYFKNPLKVYLFNIFFLMNMEFWFILASNGILLPLATRVSPCN